MKLKIYRIIFTILIISLIIVFGIISIKYYKNYLNEQENKKTVETFSRVLEIQQENHEEEQEKKQDKQKEVTLNGYKVIGIVKIPKINLEYPILDLDTYNPEETKEPMKISIVKYWGGKVNELGNLSIAGHNNYDGTMFGKTKKMQVNDLIELTDLTGNTIQYKIYNKFVTEPNDVTILETKDKTIREVTLITCTNGNRERLILKAREIQ
ncbi:MAG: sortase [Clostridia bacterium]|nr:sortase [Clostridia bacterium]